MRKELAVEQGRRKRFSALFTRLGKKTNYKGYSDETILLNNVADLETNKIVADHIWFTFTQGFMNASLSIGDMIEFDARVKEYRKGYVNKKYKINKSQIDYKLSHPTKIRKVIR